MICFILLVQDTEFFFFFFSFFLKGHLYEGKKKEKNMSVHVVISNTLPIHMWQTTLTL